MRQQNVALHRAGRPRKYFAVLALVLLACCACVSPSDSPPEPSSHEITTASFNLQVFGQTKASKPEVMEILANIIRQYDIVAIQEIRDAAETAILVLRDKVNENGAVGVLRFDTVYDFSSPTLEPGDVSDHFPV